MRPSLWANFAHALASFEVIMSRDGTDEIVRDAAIKRFEFTYEAAWRALRAAVAEEGGLDPRTVPLNEAFRVGRELGYIRETADWIAYKAARNQTAHVYHESDARAIYLGLPRFLDDARALLHRLQAAFPEP